MKNFNINGTTHLAMVAPRAQHQTEIISASGHPQAVAPLSAPSYIGGATIAIALAGMIVVAVQAAGFTSKSTTPKPQTVAIKNGSFANRRPHTSH
ncbi:MAG: hypothetical protein JOZ78_19235 [Chroococcidiopsidaceae cyanobacterium CP_BM_ER_R8_30]|nr:hypothetical protein [Chroococcidiopsidaceae cyanobacterium CP_BM_ER_R8_30]